MVDYFTTSIAIVAGLCIAFGVLYLFIGIRRQADKALNILFGLFALAYGSAILTARASFIAESVDRYASAARVSTVFAAIGFSLLIWFVAAYTGTRPRVFLGLVTASFAVIGFAAIFTPDLVVNISGGIDTVTLPWGETVMMGQTDDAALIALLQAALLVSIVYIVIADVQQFRSGERLAAVVLAIGIGWFVFTIVEESLVELDVIDFVFLSDFGFLGFVVAMGLQMVNRAIETEEELLDHQNNLEEKIAHRTSELEATQSQLLAQTEEQATMAERSRLARELHDVITQLLFSINLVSASLPRLWETDPDMARRSTLELQRLTRGALAEMRTLLRELRPQTILDTDLSVLVTQLSDGLAARQDIPVVLNISTDGSLPLDIHLTTYRIVQETLNNVAKHANASSLSIELSSSDSRVHLSITDDGYGFEPATVPAENMGLDIMKERADEIGAELTVSSTQDVGTTIVMDWRARAVPGGPR
jgi:signal transduction histidine kinase